MEEKMARFIVEVLAPAYWGADDLMEELSILLEDQETECEIISVELDDDQEGMNAGNS